MQVGPLRRSGRARRRERGGDGRADGVVDAAQVRAQRWHGEGRRRRRQCLARAYAAMGAACRVTIGGFEPVRRDAEVVARSSSSSAAGGAVIGKGVGGEGSRG